MVTLLGFFQLKSQALPAERNKQHHVKGGGTHLSEGLTGLAEKTKEQTIKQ